MFLLKLKTKTKFLSAAGNIVKPSGTTGQVFGVPSLELLSIQLSGSLAGEGTGVSKQLEYRGVYCGLLNRYQQ